MEKISSVLLIIIFTIISPSVCNAQTENVAQPRINSDNIARIAKIYDDDLKLLTKNDIAVWLIKIIKYYEDNSYNITIDINENRSQLFSEAISLGIFHGSNDIHMDDEKNATRQEAFAMVDRAFGLNPPMQLSSLSSMSDYSQVSEWATDSVHNVVNIVLDSNESHLFDNGIKPLSTITQDEMIHIITAIIKSDYCQSLSPVSESLLKKIIHFYTTLWGRISISGTVVIAILSWIKKEDIMAFLTWFRIRREVIYIGAYSCGKTALSNILPDSHRLGWCDSYVPTRDIYKKKPVIIKENNGTIVFHGIPKDTPSDSKDALYKILKSHKIIRRKKIIILLLSHTPTLTEKNTNYKYISEQLEKIKNDYIPAIKQNINRVDKIIIFINKCDILPARYANNEESTKDDIYKKLFELLSQNLQECNMYLVCGSAKTGQGIDKLYERLKK